MKNLLFGALAMLTLSLQAQDSLEVQKLGQLQYNDGINDIWGYTANGKEYALVGVNTGFSIVNVTNPSNPVEEHFLPGTNTIWRDIKTWDHYAYVVHDGVSSANSNGITIVDLNTIDSTNLSYTQVYPAVTIDSTAFNFVNAHNLYIDSSGVMYVFGSNLGIGGASMFDLTADPNNPAFLGAYNGSYYHDGVARGDTLYGAAIYKGQLEVVDVSNKSNPLVWGSKSTPNTFTHNVWFSKDNNTVFTTDEKTGAYVVAYDVSDLSNITELDRIRTSIYDPNQVIPHNVHVKGDFLVTSYYTSGLQIVDASEPDILIETAYYDTSPLSGDGYNGAWGAYPFLPSGNILVSDRQEGLFILQSSYPRACFFKCFVKDSVTQNPIAGADITMVRTNIAGQTDLFGNFKGGRRDTGNFLVVVEKPGYQTDTLHVNMRRGITKNRTVALLPLGFSIDENGRVSGNVSIYPNPSQGSFTIEMEQIEDPQASIEISDLSGRIHYSQSVPLGNGKITVETELNHGVYNVKIVSGLRIYATQRLFVIP